MTPSNANKSPATLDEAKQLVEQDYLGREGIHAVGKQTGSNTVRVYATTASAEFNSVLNTIKQRCAPFAVDVVLAETPHLTAGSEAFASEKGDEGDPE